MATANIGIQRYPSLLRQRPLGRQHLGLLSLLFLACGCLCLQLGCLAIPIPQGYRNIEREGKRIGEARLNFVVPGQTTKAEFIEKIGRPYLMMDDAGVMAYYWKMLAAYVPWVAGSYGAGAAGIGEVDRQYLLLVSYDNQGVIQRYEIIHHVFELFPKTVNEIALNWDGKDASLGKKFTTVNPPAGQSAVYVFHRFSLGEALQSPDRPDGVFLDGNLWAELKRQQYVPIVISPGHHSIGFERDIRATDKFLHPDREAPAPFLTETIDAKPNQAYFFEVSFIESVSRDFKKTPIFSRLSEDVALPKLAGLKRAR